MDEVKLPLKMTKVPILFSIDNGASFLGFARYSLKDKLMIEHFKKNKGIDLNNLVQCSTIEQMIDNATGHAEDILSKFLDWLVINYWGEEK